MHGAKEETAQPVVQDKANKEKTVAIACMAKKPVSTLYCFFILPNCQMNLLHN